MALYKPSPRNRSRQDLSLDRDYDELVPQFDQRRLLSLSRGIFASVPLVKAAITSKADYSIGNACAFRSLSSNSDFVNEASGVMDRWCKRATVNDLSFNSLCWLISTKIDIDGDCFILLTKDDAGVPKLQLIEAHAVGSRKEDVVKHSAKLHESKGVLYNPTTRKHIAYRVLGATEKDDKVVSATQLIQFKEPSNELRGTPIAACCIGTIHDLMKSQELLLIQQINRSAISFVEHNEMGQVDALAAVTMQNGDGTTSTVEVMPSEGGEVRYYKAGTDSKLEFVDSKNPSNEWQQYAMALTNQIIIALDWNKILLGIGDVANGTQSRLAMMTCVKATEDRHGLIATLMEIPLAYVVATFMTNGKIKTAAEDFYNITLSKPKSLSIDLGRDSRALKEQLADGRTNLTQIVNEEGRTIEEHLRERYREEALRIQIKDEVEKEYGVEIDDFKARQIGNPPVETVDDVKEEEIK